MVVGVYGYFNSSAMQTPRTAPQNKVTITPGRHSRVLLAGIRKKTLDAHCQGKACGDRLCGNGRVETALIYVVLY